MLLPWACKQPERQREKTTSGKLAQRSRPLKRFNFIRCEKVCLNAPPSHQIYLFSVVRRRDFDDRHWIPLLRIKTIHLPGPILSLSHREETCLLRKRPNKYILPICSLHSAFVSRAFHPEYKELPEMVSRNVGKINRQTH